MAPSQDDQSNSETVPHRCLLGTEKGSKPLRYTQQKNVERPVPACRAATPRQIPRGALPVRSHPHGWPEPGRGSGRPALQVSPENTGGDLRSRCQLRRPSGKSVGPDQAAAVVVVGRSEGRVAWKRRHARPSSSRWEVKATASSVKLWRCKSPNPPPALYLLPPISPSSIIITIIIIIIMSIGHHHHHGSSGVRTLDRPLSSCNRPGVWSSARASVVRWWRGRASHIGLGGRVHGYSWWQRYGFPQPMEGRSPLGAG